jgi:hypothetical protein
MTTSFQILSSSSFSGRPTIQRCIIWILTALLNKPQEKENTSSIILWAFIFYSITILVSVLLFI